MKTTVQQLVKRVTLHRVEEVLLNITIASLYGQRYIINTSSVKVVRMNYPYNCFTLDLTNNTDLKREMGLKQLFLYFPVLANHSVEIHPIGKSLECGRIIKSHKFFSSGANIKQLNLGKKNNNHQFNGFFQVFLQKAPMFSR